MLENDCFAFVFEHQPGYVQFGQIVEAGQAAELADDPIGVQWRDGKQGGDPLNALRRFPPDLKTAFGGPFYCVR